MFDTMFVTRVIALHYNLLKIDSRIMVYSLHINVAAGRYPISRKRHRLTSVVAAITFEVCPSS